MEQEQHTKLQKLMDNMWLLIILGITVPFVSYALWGLIELMNIKPGTLP